MSANIIKHLESYMGTAIHNVDPNTQTVNKEKVDSNFDLIAQAAIPAVLAAVYKYSRSEEGAEYLAKDTAITPSRIFADQDDEIASRIASFSKIENGFAARIVNDLTAETVRYYRSEMKNDISADKVQLFFGSIRENILGALPADLQLGNLLNDDTLDDNTNKMKGPASGLAQSIQNAFSSVGTKREES